MLHTGLLKLQLEPLNIIVSLFQELRQPLDFCHRKVFFFLQLQKNPV